MLYALLAFGMIETALLLSFGHAALRMWQLLRAHNVILEHHQLTAAMRGLLGPTSVSTSTYRMGWRMNRLMADAHQLPHMLHLFRGHYRHVAYHSLAQ